MKHAHLSYQNTTLIVLSGAWAHPAIGRVCLDERATLTVTTKHTKTMLIYIYSAKKSDETNERKTNTNGFNGESNCMNGGDGGMVHAIETYGPYVSGVASAYRTRLAAPMHDVRGNKSADKLTYQSRSQERMLLPLPLAINYSILRNAMPNNSNKPTDSIHSDNRKNINNIELVTEEIYKNINI